MAQICHVSQSRRQIHPCHIGGIVSGGGNAQNGAGVLRGLIGVQPVFHRLCRALHNGLVVDGGRLPLQQAGGAKPHHLPVAVHGAGGWGVLRQQVLPGLPEGGLPRGLLPAGRLCAAGGEQQAQQQDKRQDILFHGGHGQFLLTEIPYISGAVFRPVPHGVMSASRPAPANRRRGGACPTRPGAVSAASPHGIIVGYRCIIPQFIRRVKVFRRDAGIFHRLGVIRLGNSGTAACAAVPELPIMPPTPRN